MTITFFFSRTMKICVQKVRVFRGKKNEYHTSIDIYEESS